MRKIIKDSKDLKKTTLDKPLIEVYKKLELGDHDLIIFLNISGITLLKIDAISRYSRAVESNLTNNRKDSLNIDSEKQTELLENENDEELNRYVKHGILIIFILLN